MWFFTLNTKDERNSFFWYLVYVVSFITLYFNDALYFSFCMALLHMWLWITSEDDTAVDHNPPTYIPQAPATHMQENPQLTVHFIPCASSSWSHKGIYIDTCYFEAKSLWYFNALWKHAKDFLYRKDIFMIFICLDGIIDHWRSENNVLWFDLGYSCNVIDRSIWLKYDCLLVGNSYSVIDINMKSDCWLLGYSCIVAVF